MNKKQSNYKRRNGGSGNNNSTKGGLNKRRNSNQSRFSDSDVSREEKTNNPAWYKTNPSLVEGIANLPFNIPTGDTFDLVNSEGVQGSKFVTNYSPKVSSPGVAVFDVVPTFGKQTERNSSLNIAAQAIYTWVRYYNSGSRNYMANDLMVYLIANAQIYSMINWAMRIYGTIKQYDHRNKYMSRYLIEAMRVDYDDLLGRMAEFRGRLNLLIDKASSFVVPNTMTYFMRTASMFTDIYSDGTSLKDQFYMYNPVGFYRLAFDYSEEPIHDASYLHFEVLTSDDHLMTVDDIMRYIDDSINAIFYSHDQGVISGDLYKAYSGNILTLQPLSEGYVTNIVNDPWVLNQIKNATITSFWSYPDLYQNVESGFIVFDPRVEHVIKSSDSTGIQAKYRFIFRGMAGNRVLTVEGDNPNTDHVMEYTRLMTNLRNISEETNDEGNIVVKGEMVVGTEIILRARFYDFRAASVGAISSGINTSNYWYYMRAMDAGSDTLRSETLKAAFPYFPATINFSTNTDGSIAVLGLAFNYDNYTLVDAEEISHLHEVAIMNMFATEAVAKLK